MIIENEARPELIVTGTTLVSSINLESGLFGEQGLTCANHSDEVIVLDKIGWKNFVCPKCGVDYSIGRKISSSNKLPMNYARKSGSFQRRLVVA